MKKLLLAFTSAVLFLFISSFAEAQTTLSPGDIAVVGYDFSFNTTTTAPVGSDNFDIVVLKNITAGTVINFTSRGWLGTGFSSVGTIDGLFTWTVGTNITAGSVFNFSIANGTLPATVTVSPSNGAVTGTTTTMFTSTVGYSPSTGNQILIYQGTAAAPTFIYGINTNATNAGANGWVTGTVANNAAQSALPTGLTDSDPFDGTVSAPTALAFTLETNRYNAVYVGPLVGSQTTLLTDIGNYANWTATSTATTTYNIAVGGTYFPSANPVFNLATPTITASGTLAALTTTTGTASSSTSFSVSATALTAGVLVTPPTGFEVSTDNSTFSSTVTVGSSGTLAATTIYVRLAAADGVGTYSGNVVLSSTGATSVNVATASSTVNAVPTITTSGTLVALSTTSGTASSSTSFIVSGTALPNPVAIDAPANFELSNDNSNFGFSIILAYSYTLAPTTIYIRLAAADGPGIYSGNVLVHSTGATSVNVPIPNSAVSGVTVSSITYVSSNLTNASSVQYTLTFGGSVIGLSASNFSLTTTGSVSGAAISAISGSGPTYTITVNTGTGDGTIGLNLANATGISPGLATTLPFTGSTYTIDKTPPTVTISAPSVSSTSTGPVTYTVTYADANFNSSTLAAGNITLNKTGTATGSVAVSGTGLTRTVTISSISGTGSIGISIAAGTASDNAGNLAGAAGPSATFTVAPAGPAIADSGTLSSLNSIYGSASASESFNVSGSNMTAGILVTPPAGFEVSTDNSTFSSTVTIGAAGTIASTPVYIRLKAGEAAGNYSGNVVLSSSGASSVNEAMPVGVVSQASLAIIANNQSKVYGGAVPTLTASYSGFVNGDTPASLTTPPTITTTATAASQVAGNPYAITASGAVDPNYAIFYIPGSLSVTAVPLTITADNQTKAYGAAIPTLTASYSGFVNGDTPISLTTPPTITTTATAASQVAGNPYAITASGAVDANYAISYVPGILTITQAALTITADNQTKAYGAAIPTLTASYSGFVNGDTPISLTTPPTITTTATAASQVTGNPYAITASGAVDPNYVISYVPGSLTVGQAPLTITADNQTKVYGAAIPTLTASYSGFVNGDTPISLTVPPTITTTATAASQVAGNPYAITASGAVDPNYTISYVPGILTIGQAPLTITADNQTKAYGAAIPTLTASYAGFVNGDTQASLTTPPTITTTATAASQVAGNPYAITAGGAVDPNYAISYVPGILTIGQAPLTITADNQTKAYGAAIPTLTASYTGFVNGDNTASLTTPPTITTTATAASQVAGNPYAITASGAVDANYAISYVPGTLTIGQAPLTITADNQSSIYGQALPALTVSYAGFVNGDTQASLTTAATASTTATAASPAGSYTITPSGAVDNNYTITYTNGTLTIGQAALTITADNQTSTYGQALPALTVSYAGFVNGDTQASLTTAATASTTATAASPAGSYTITPSGAVDNNYAITYTNGILTIGQAALNVTADNQNTTYGQALPALTVTYAGFVNGDTQASLTTAATAITSATAASPAGSYTITPSGAVDNNYAITYTNGTLTIGQAALNVTADNQNTTYGQALPALTVSYAGFVNGDTQASLTTAATASTTATAASPAGSYTITPSGAVDNNYAITYTNGTLTIGQAALTVTANNQSSTYGQALPALTVSYAGFVNGDTQASLTTAATASTTATAASPVGSYTITPSGAVDNNYTITYTNGTLTIGQAALTITADNQSKVYGAALPALTVSYAGFVNGDTQASLTTAATASTTATAASPAGSYTITPSGAVDNNYTITYTNGTLTIGQAALTVTADNQSSTYGQALPALTVSYAGFVNGDTQASLTTAATASTTATAASPAGSYTITPSGAVDNNYAITYTNGTLTIGQAALTVTADNQTSTYGSALPALTVSYAGFVNGDTQASLTTAATASTTATAASPAGSYTITPSGAVDNNYQITYTNGTLTIGQAALTVTANNQTSTYGQALPALTVSYAGFVNGDTQASLTTAATASTTATAASPAGSYTITPSGAVDNNYAITYTNGTLTIGQAALNITADNQTSTYGSALPALTVSYAGFVNGDTQASLTTAATTSTTATAASPAGSYTITPSGAVDNNYAITYTNGTLTIGQAALTITADNQNTTYGQAIPALTVSYAGFVNGDTQASLTTAATASTTATAASPAGSYAITPSGAVDNNYAITYTNGTLTIGQAALNITADNQTSTYGSALPALTVSYAGFVNGDTQASLTTAATASTTATAASPAGSYTITPSGAVDNNYAITYTNGTLTIGQAALTVTADNQSSTYGQALPALTVSYSGFVNGDTQASLTTAATASTTATAASPAGSYTITPSGAVDNNYAITYTNGTLTIGQAGLSITADNQNTTYGQALPALTVSYAGFVNGDTQASLTTAATASTTATAASPAGSYTITPSGAVDNNYAITYTNGTLTIGQAALTITADNQSKVYGAAVPTLTASYTGFVNGDTQASLTTAPTLSTTATASSAAGTYPVTASGAADNNYTISYVPGTLTIGQAALTITANNQNSTYGSVIPALTVTYSGFVNGDTQASLTTAATASTTATAASPAGSYTITPSGAVDNNYAITYTNGTLTIGQAVLTITADNQNSTYGSVIPALTVSYSGFVNGDTQASLTTAATASTTATAASPAGSYTITPSGAADNNYAITYANGTLTIGQAVLTVTADNQNTTYGSALPALTVTYSGFVNGDTQASLTTAATASTTATTASPAGSYTITPGGAVDNNYTITYTNGTLTIGQAALTVTANNQSSIYGQAIPALTVAYSGFVNGDTQASLTTAATASTTATAASMVGVYPITPAGAVDNNYAITYVNGTLTITAATATLTFAPIVVKTYGDADFGPGATTSGGETIIYTSSNTAVATIVNGAIHITGAGTTTITATLAASSDYTTIPSISRQLVVNKAQQTISFAAIPNQLKGGHYDLSGVTASSGLAVSFSSSNPLVAAVQGGNSLASFQLGTTDITASQSGDNNYEAAPNVTQPVNVVDAAGDDILVHQAVSPNGDGINDFLYIEGIQNYPENEVTLISRNGVIVYQGFKYDNTSHVFDGHSNITGALQQAGTYFYRVEIIVNGERKSKTGYFVLKYQ
ncbi:MBG domain-containing protein [Mucilaginibacter sp. X4EP1]|uniref:MBG domain-containing protein n=1 Tax=Mucilaginibacter sp. X4EP1 TaxID=2723092 RepID=UPI003AFFE32E